MARINIGPLDREFGQMLQAARLRAKLTQADVGRQFKIEPQAVSGWERGTSRPEIEKLIDLADLYQSTVEEICGRKRATRSAEALLIGTVGAGAEITRFDDQDVLGTIPVSPGAGIFNAVRIVGDSQYPLQEGWLILYGAENQGVSDECIGKLSVLKVKDGSLLLKTIRRSANKGLFRLESWNAPPREDVRLEWASKVKQIRPD